MPQVLTIAVFEYRSANNKQKALGLRLDQA